MLSAYPAGRIEGSSIFGCTWIDLVDPTEIGASATFEQTFGLRVPSQEDQLVEIGGRSSRLQIEKDALYMTAPLIFTADAGPWISAPSRLRAVEAGAPDRANSQIGGGRHGDRKNWGHQEGIRGNISPLCASLRALVDRLADLLEATSHDLDEGFPFDLPDRQDAKRLSRGPAVAPPAHDPHWPHQRTHGAYPLHPVCLDRMAKFAVERGHDWISHDMVVRLQAVIPRTSPPLCSSPKAWSAGCSCSRTPPPASSTSIRTT